VLKKTLESTEAVLGEVDKRIECVDQYQKRIQETIQKYKKIHDGIEEHLTKIAELEHLVKYFLVLQDIQDISAELTNCINSKDEQKIVNLFLSLSGSPESTDSVIGRLQEVDAPHMKLYARRMALYWHDVIKEKLSW
jgi:RAD50-interacting protein 1